MDGGFEACGGVVLRGEALHTATDDQVDDRHSLGDLLVECRHLLLPWLRRERARRNTAPDAAIDLDDLLSEASARAIKAFPALRSRARGPLVQLVKKILHDLLCDEVRHMQARSRGVGVAISLSDSAAAALAESIAEDCPGTDADAARREMMAKLCSALKRLPRDESRVVRCWMCGRTWEQIESRFGTRSRRLWRSALPRLRAALDDERGSRDGRKRGLGRKPQ